MSHIARLRKVGGSVMLAIPPALLDALDLGSDASVGLTVEAGALRIEPRPKARHTLDELLAQCDPQASAPEDRDWLDGPAKGREIL